jgi:hypothetical protein
MTAEDLAMLPFSAVAWYKKLCIENPDLYSLMNQDEYVTRFCDNVILAEQKGLVTEQEIRVAMEANAPGVEFAGPGDSQPTVARGQSE